VVNRQRKLDFNCGQTTDAISVTVIRDRREPAHVRYVAMSAMPPKE